VKAYAIIEVRMKSSRLPGKNLLPILGRPMLEMLVERLSRCISLAGIVVATTTDSTDDAIEAVAQRLGVACFRGSMDDVLDRVLRAAFSVDANIIVEITGDCPLSDPLMVDEMVATYLEMGVDYVGNMRPNSNPLGMAVQVFSTDVLATVASLTQDPVDHEHVSLYIYEHPERFSLHNVDSGLPEKYLRYRLTVDTPEDFALVSRVFEALYPLNPAFGLGEVLAFLDHNPALLELNSGICQKAVR
jgi:spore coat polysaccharide biosynthesis protein SpsF